MSAGYGLRRPSVNVVGSGGSSYDDDTENRRRRNSCPRCEIGLIFREDLNSLFCKRCAYMPPLPELPKSKTEPAEGDNNNNNEEEEEEPMTTIDGLQTKIGQRGTTTLEEEADNAIRIRAIGNAGRTRYEQLRENPERNRYGITTPDPQRDRFITDKGYTITDSSEEISSDGTYNSQDMINRRRGRF
jgi:ribosomal protein S27AE